MGEVLSQDEVDSLLTGLSEGKIETETDKGPEDGGEGPSQAYDFSSQERVVIRGRMPTFEVINERFARDMRTSLSNLLRTTVDINAEGLETLKFSEFGRSLPVPTSMHVFRMEPLRGHALLVMESQLVFNLIDTFFGGKGMGNAKVEGREFTAIEEKMIYKVVVACIKDLQNAWQPVEPITTSLVRSEVNPQFAAIVMPTDLVVVTKYEIELEQAAGTLVVCLPYAMLEPLRSKLSAGFQAEIMDTDYVWQKRLKEIILNSTVDFVVKLGSVNITGERLINMKTGDVIQLEQDADAPLKAFIEGMPKVLGLPGTQKGFQAIRIEKKLRME